MINFISEVLGNAQHQSKDHHFSRMIPEHDKDDKSNPDQKPINQSSQIIKWCSILYKFTRKFITVV